MNALIAKISLFANDQVDGIDVDWRRIDVILAVSLLVLAGLGLVMVASSSISIADKTYDDSLYFFKRQLMFVALGLCVGLIAFRIPMNVWKTAAPIIFGFAVFLLILVLIPGVGHKVKGATRWINLWVFNFQVSELMKLAILFYMASYMVRKSDRFLTQAHAFAFPLGVLIFACILIELGKDLGTTFVIFSVGVTMLFLGGMRLWQYFLILGGGAAVGGLLILSKGYRMARLASFMDPWEEKFGNGWQLVNSLMAYGQGSWDGVGLGNSVRKMFYLPDAHTDFVFAVLAEELGLIGVVITIALFTAVIWRAFVIASKAEKCGQYFSCHIAQGIGVWIGIQSFFNIAVTMGAVPTKGLTLPLISYGGSSTLVIYVALAILLRISCDVESASADNRGTVS